jgi:hypothetical protein
MNCCIDAGACGVRCSVLAVGGECRATVCTIGRWNLSTGSDTTNEKSNSTRMRRMAALMYCMRCRGSRTPDECWTSKSCDSSPTMTCCVLPSAHGARGSTSSGDRASSEALLNTLIVWPLRYGGRILVQDREVAAIHNVYRCCAVAEEECV